MGSILDDLKHTWGKPNPLMARLILINVFVFIFINIIWLLTPESFYAEVFKNFAMPTALFSEYHSNLFIYKPWTFITAFFTHKSFGHILYNMLGLYWFGSILRDFLGDRKLLGVYMIGGMVGSLSMLVLFNLVPYFAGSNGIGLGASAAVFAIAAAAATKFPDYKLNLMFIGPVKIQYIVLVYVFLSFLGLKADNVGGEVAHLAGALIGFIYIKQLDKGIDLGSPILSVIDFGASFFKPKSKIKVSHRGAKRTASKKSTFSSKKKTNDLVVESDQDEIDAILDKISQSGYESLTKEEKQKLFNASNK